jgi:hypothetical protein
MKLNKKTSQSDYDLGVICKVCDSVTMYDHDCGCHICIICEQRKKIENENIDNNSSMGII